MQIEGRDAVADAARSPAAGSRPRPRAAPARRIAIASATGLAVPDPASRAQADDVHGPSLVVDPRAYRWRNADWRGRPWHETVLYELHAGLSAASPACSASLPRLADLGITAIELMPINDFPGKRNWGYDGVLPFAPDRAYGTPDDLKALVDAAHGHGLMIFLDVVYNHFGPDGNYLASYADVLPRRRRDAMGRGDRFPPRGGAALLHRERALLADGVSLRRPALRCRARDHRSRTGSTRWRPRSARRSRRTATSISCSSTTAMSPIICARDFDAQWNDDGHHVLHVLLTGEREGYYADYADRPAERLARCLAEGFVYQGEPSAHRKGETRGTPSARSAADRLRAVPAEPRPDRQPRLRRPPDRAACRRRRSRPRSRCSCSARRFR